MRGLSKDLLPPNAEDIELNRLGNVKAFTVNGMRFVSPHEFRKKKKEIKDARVK